MSQSDSDTITAAKTQYANDLQTLNSLPDGDEREALVSKITSYAHALNAHYSAIVIDLEALYAAELYGPEPTDPSAADGSAASEPPAEPDHP